MDQIICERCGAPLTQKQGEYYVCEYCNAKFKAEDSSAEEPSVQTSLQVQSSEESDKAALKSEQSGNGAASQTNNPSPKKKTLGMILGIIFSSIFLAAFVGGLIVALTSSSGGGNVLLLLSGIAGLCVAVIFYKVADHKQKYTCPQCGAKRTHHRELDDTEERDSSFGGNMPGEKTTYTHHYTDTYVCPKCDTTLTLKVKKSGGTYTEYDNGKIADHRIRPREF